MVIHFGRRTLLFCATLVAVVCFVAVAATESIDESVRAAIVAGVRAKLGSNVASTANVDVRVEDLQVRGQLTQTVVAQVPPGARTGIRTRFVLLSAETGGTQVGEADATIVISGPHVRAARGLHRGAALDASAVIELDGDVGSIPIQTLASRATLGGAVAAREILQGDVLVASLLTMPALVKSGDHVVVRAAAGAVYVQAVVVAAQQGGLGDIIRCVNPDTRKAMAARIVAPGLAEVVHVF